MNNQIDCLFIGHNEMDFDAYEKIVRAMGEHSGAYRDLNLNFVQYRRNFYTLSDVYNLFLGEDGQSVPLRLSDTFSATIAYLGTFLTRNGFSFDYISSFQAEKDILARKLTEDHYLVIGILTTLYVAPFPIFEIISFIREHLPKVTIVVGGPFISTNTRAQDQTALQSLFRAIGADIYINSSQGENTLIKVIRARKNHLPLSEVPNIYFAHNGDYLATPVDIENNLLEQNMVDWSLFREKAGRFVAVRTAISCPFSCAFCGFPEHAGKYQTASVEAIERELDGLSQIETVTSINFIDDTFNVPPERFKDILRMMIQKRYRFKWHSYFRCQYADREMIELMKESGCEGVFLGIESGNQQILKNMNKKVTLEKYRDGLALLKEMDIVTFASFIIGFPGETPGTIEDTMQFIEETGPDFYRAQLWYCEPITPIWKEREQYQIEGAQFNWSHRTMDSNMACNLIDKIFLSVKNSVWLPQYNFDFVNIFHLIHRGMSLQQVKRLIETFNEGLKQKIIDPGQKEIGGAVIKRLVQLGMDAQGSPQPAAGKEINQRAFHYQADFDL